MPQIVGCNGVVGVDDSSATCRAITGDGNSVTMNYTAEVPEVTTFGNCTRTRKPDGMKDVSFDYAGFFNTTDTTGIDAIFYGILGGSSRFIWMPGGQTAGCVMYSTCVILSDYSVAAPVDGMVTATATFVNRSGSLTRGVVIE